MDEDGKAMEIGLVLSLPSRPPNGATPPPPRVMPPLYIMAAHSLFGRHLGVGPNPPGVAQIVHGHQAYAVFASLVHGEPRGERRNDLAESAVAVDLGHCHMLPDHLRLSHRIDSPFLDAPDIWGDAY